MKTHSMKTGVACAALLLASAAGCGPRSVGQNGGEANAANTNSSAPVPARAVPAALGQKVTVGGFEITVVAVSQVGELRSQYGTDKADRGGVFVTATYTLKNVGNRPIPGLNNPEFVLIDPSGAMYRQDSGATSTFAQSRGVSGTFNSDINPGIEVDYVAVWQVAADRFDRETWQIALEGHEGSRFDLR